MTKKPQKKNNEELEDKSNENTTFDDDSTEETSEKNNEELEDKSNENTTFDDDSTEENITQSSAPGFGILSSLTSLGAVAYLLKNRFLSENDSES